MQAIRRSPDRSRSGGWTHFAYGGLNDPLLHHRGSWPACEELDQEDIEDSTQKRMVTFADELNRQRQQRSAGDESGEEPRKGLSAVHYTLVLDPQLNTVTLKPREERELDQDDIDQALPPPPPRFRSHRRHIIRDDDEEQEDHETERRSEPDELNTEEDGDQNDFDGEEDTGELVDDDEEEAERAEQVAEELAPFDVAADHLRHLLDELTHGHDGRGRKRYLYDRSRVVAVSGGLRTLKQRVEELVEPLTAHCPGNAADVRQALRSLSNAVVHLLNGIQARVDTYTELKMGEVLNLVAAIRPLLVDLLLEACSVAEANHDLIRQATLLKEAITLGAATVKTLKRAWDEMLDISRLSKDIKHMVRLCLLASDITTGMRDTTAKRVKRRSVRLGKAADQLVKGVREGIEVDNQFDRLISALTEWLSAVNQAHQELRRLR